MRAIIEAAAHILVRGVVISGAAEAMAILLFLAALFVICGVLAGAF